MTKTYVFSCNDYPGRFHTVNIHVTADSFEKAEQQAFAEAKSVLSEIIRGDSFEEVEATLERVEVTA
jgi:hypothetical protein